MQLPQEAPTLGQILDELSAERIRQLVREPHTEPTVRNRYIHWDRLRRLRRTPQGISHREWWASIKLARTNGVVLPLVDGTGRPFQFFLADSVQQYLHELDGALRSVEGASSALVSGGQRNRYLASALIEEAVKSSQLEGAATTRQRAKEMIKSQRKPRDQDERMVLNNYETMSYLRDVTDHELDLELVCDLHRRITRGTLDNPDEEGALRATNDVVVLHDNTEVHRPPNYTELDQRLKRMCDFANEKLPQRYLHPIIRAVLLHHWLAYEHPFVDGNGRTARALFYWSLLKHRDAYPLAEFVSISNILRNAPSRYARSYLYCTTDGNDVTYFVLYQLEVLKRAISSLHDYMTRKSQLLHDARRVLPEKLRLNHRQVDLMSRGVQSPDSQFTVASWATVHRVSRPTARSDLRGLRDLGLLEASQVGLAEVFEIPRDLEARLAQLDRRLDQRASRKTRRGRRRKGSRSARQK